ncbi:MAG TPA: hypothetical protein VF469_17855 [Kofleriaceae bacterium]
MRLTGARGRAGPQGVVELHVPPLRERRDDILPLARVLLADAALRITLPRGAASGVVRRLDEVERSTSSWCSS